MIDERVGFENRRDGFDVVSGLGVEVIDVGVVNISGRIFEIINVVSQPLQADQVVEELKGDAAEGLSECDWTKLVIERSA